MYKNIALVFAVTFFFLSSANNVSAGQEHLMFGVHPFKKPVELMRMFSPLLKHLEKELDVKISFRSSINYEMATAALVEGAVDFSYIGPASFAILSQQYPGKFRIAAALRNQDGTPTFKGVFVVREDSPFTSLKDLQGKKIAFGDRKSTLSCIMPAYMLIQAGIFDSISYHFVGSHDNVAKGIISNRFQGGGLKPNIAQKYIGKGLKVIAESEPVYEHVFVMGPSVDDETAKKIRTAFLNLKDPKVYLPIKKNLRGFTLVTPKDYNNLKEIIRTVDKVIPK